MAKSATSKVADMFGGDRFGRVTDPFGQGWALATRKEDLTPRQLAARAKAAMTEMAAGKLA